MERKEDNMRITYGLYESPFGWCVIGMTDKKICQITFLKTKSESEAIKKLRAKWPEVTLTRKDETVTIYAQQIFKNKKQNSNVQFFLKGTDFQIKVWEALLTIPKGKTATYAEIAKRIKAPKAVRAVGTACGKNAIPFLIPCHRVVASDGTLGGYSGGLPLKKAMLAVENSLAK